MEKKVYLFLLLSFCTQTLFSQTIFARSNGDWDQTTVWSTVSTGGVSCGCTPVPGDDVLIDGYDVDIDAGTGDVTVNSIIITNVRGTDVRLRIQGGATLTVTNDFEIESNSGGNDAELTVVNTGSGLDISGDFLADQDAGDDLLIDIDSDGQVNILGDANFLQDGGDDMELNLNLNSGTSAQWNVSGTLTFEHNAGDDIRVRLDEVSSLLTVREDAIVNMNAGLDDDFTYNLDGGNMNITGDVKLNRSSNTGFVRFDMDGGNMSCDSLICNSSGALFTLGALHFFLDETSEINCDDVEINMTGADDLYLHLNDNSGNSAEFNVANNFILNREDGDDVEILVDEDNSEFIIGGDFIFTSDNGEEIYFGVDDDATWDIGGDLEMVVTVAEDFEIDLHGGGDNPTLNVDGNFSLRNETGNVDCLIDINGGTFSVGLDVTLTNDSGADDLDIDIDEDGIFSIGNDFHAEITGGDDLRIDLGANTPGSNGRFDIGGNATIHLSNDAGSSPIWRLRIYDNCRFTVGGDLTLDTDFTTTGLCLVDVQNTAEIDVDGDVNLLAEGSGELEIRLDDDSFFRIGGDFIRAASPNNFGELDASSSNGTVEYRGGIEQVIAEDNGGGGDSFRYMNLEIDNSFGTIPQLTLEGDVTVNGELIMNDGIVASDVSDILIVANDATSSNASNDSYVDGYMRKVGNDAFVFPSGNGGFYAPIGISAPSGTTHSFEAQYFLANPNDAGFDSTSHDASISHISKVEYWKLNRTVGGSNPTVTISWDTPRSGGVVNTADLRFARWDGAIWRDLGNTSTTGSAVSGTLDNSTGITTFTDGNPLTLASIIPLNPLPIELTSFTASLNNGITQLNWITKSEINNDYFTLEKSNDGINWQSFSQIKGTGNSSIEQTYYDLDRTPFGGLSYYRLIQTDFDGNYKYFEPISIDNSQDNIIIYPNPANNIVYLVGDIDPITIRFYSIDGQRIPVSYEKENNKIIFNTESLANGTYIIHNGTEVKRLVIAH